jgi:hypothetical protein
MKRVFLDSDPYVLAYESLIILNQVAADLHSDIKKELQIYTAFHLLSCQPEWGEVHVYYGRQGRICRHLQVDVAWLRLKQYFFTARVHLPRVGPGPAVIELAQWYVNSHLNSVQGSSSGPKPEVLFCQSPPSDSDLIRLLIRFWQMHQSAPVLFLLFNFLSRCCLLQSTRGRQLPSNPSLFMTLALDTTRPTSLPVS